MEAIDTEYEGIVRNMVSSCSLSCSIREKVKLPASFSMFQILSMQSHTFLYINIMLLLDPNPIEKNFYCARKMSLF